MVVIHSYPIAVVMCLVVMLCWGSWPNAQKLGGMEWKFQLFYWDFSAGVLIFSLGLAFTMGSMGSEGSSFLDNLGQAGAGDLISALFGGVLTNLGNMFLVSAIEIAGMAVAFPIGVGLALVLGIVSTYLVDPSGNPILIALGVSFIVMAMLFDSIAYKRIPSAESFSL